MSFSERSSTTIKLGQRASMRFNILVVGESKRGKSTFLRCLLNKYSDKIEQKDNAAQESDQKNAVKLFGTVELTGDCQVHLYESIGFGDQVNSEDSVDRVRSVLLHAHQKWNATSWNRVTEQDMKRSDDRIHCVFYLLSPHKVKHIDIQCFENLCSLAPIVPIVVKADCMTLYERKRCLLEVNRQIHVLSAKLGKPVVFDFNESNELFIVEKHLMEKDVTSPRRHSDSQDHQHHEAIGPSKDIAGLFNPDRVELSCFLDQLDAHQDHQQDSPTNSMQYSMLAGLLEEEDSSATIVADSNVTVNTVTAEDVEENEETPSEGEIHYGLSHFEEQESDLMRSTTTLDCSGCSATGDLPVVANIFAVICAPQDSGERVYPWGSVRIDDERCSDFRRLQRLVLECENVTEMIAFTQQVSIRLAVEEDERKKVVSASKSSMKGLLEMCTDLLGWVSSQVRGEKQTTPPSTTAFGGMKGPEDQISWRNLTWPLSERCVHLLRVTFDCAVFVALALVVCAAACQLKILLVQRFGG